MADTSLSLDDIIKKKSLGMRGRGGIRRGVPNRGARANGSVRGRGSSQVIRDARFKIIQKNREKLTDARDKLAEIAKQSDARLKLDKIRASHYKKIDTQLPGISRKTGRNGRLSLSTNKMPSLMQHVLPSNIPTNYMQPSTRTVGYRPPLAEPYIGEMNMDYTDDYLTDSPSLRRTVSNEYAPTPPPPPPVFNINPISPYTWVKSRNTNVTRIPARKSEIEKERERQRDYNKLAARSAMVKTALPSYKEDWNFGTKSRTIVAEETADSKYYDSRNLREVGIKSRLDASGNKTRTLSVLSRPKASSSSSAQSNGYRIVVSNLQANVTQEDIKELFEDVGELLVSRLVRPGTAEVIYKTLKDATKAVETYHNRQLDGHPMKCLLVNPRSKNNPTGPAVRSLTESRRSISSSYVQPSLGAVHRALFDDS
ncbi:PREDICTED: polymerase delta-interacting protein 3-like isoform X1 [Trachymyrmex septentrionalis]|uniref:polymerase delta-interacting protein 3-like isoform X1 n=1 Tax=Trachymyrmex septentrionalis TaxID=34720 RepID=UPI00084F82E6|nr:PREDICTED: polymerase delta-interacting protein 3-like isoform X1 [Trachymyrmex septentrionalis]